MAATATSLQTGRVGIPEEIRPAEAESWEVHRRARPSLSTGLSTRAYVNRTVLMTGWSMETLLLLLLLLLLHLLFLLSLLFLGPNFPFPPPPPDLFLTAQPKKKLHRADFTVSLFLWFFFVRF